MADPKDVLDELGRIAPSFEDFWAENSFLYSNDDGRYDHIGLMLSFRSFFQISFATFSDAELTNIARALERYLQSDDAKLEDAAGIFIEGPAGEAWAERMKQFLGPFASKEWKKWDRH